jgi:hypothetical protein
VLSDIASRSVAGACTEVNPARSSLAIEKSSYAQVTPNARLQRGLVYDITRDRLELTHRNGKVHLVARRLLPELDSVPPAILRSIAVSPACDAISWRDVKVVPFE